MPMKFEDQIAVCKAIGEGKKIEIYDCFASRWFEVTDKEDHLFNFRDKTYRIKPEKPKILHQYLIRNKRGDLYATGRFFQSIDDCRKEYPLTTVISVLPHTRIGIFE